MTLEKGRIWLERQIDHGHCGEGNIERASRTELNGRISAIMARLDEADRLEALLASPEIRDFADGVVREAAHQRERWGAEHDAGKAAPDWFWLVGYLAGKALQAAIAGNVEKALHHCISTAATLANWHANLTGQNTAMRPGIEPPVQDVDYHGSFGA